MFIFPNQKNYIGQTNNLKRRFHTHKTVSKNLKYNTPVYNAIRKYGWNNIKIKNLMRCQPEDIDDLERFYIKKFKTLNHKYGYNLDSGGVFNKKHSKSTRLKISQANKAKSAHTFRTRSKVVSAYTLRGDFTATYESASEAARTHGVAANTIARAARGDRKTSCGFVWKYLV